MSDISALPASLGIEAVECTADGAGGVSVRVSGRWRRRAEWRGPPVLVVETAAHGRRRLAALPEPPSLSGALPGTWRVSFSVPPELVRSLAGPTWLQLGGTMAPLALALPPSRQPVDPLDDSRGLEVRAHDLRRPRGGEIERLETELAQARSEPERLQALIDERERELRRARQSWHAEAAVRRELEEQLAGQCRATEAMRRRAQAAAERAGELSRELRSARRAIDEAEQAAALAARSARATGSTARAHAAVLQREITLARRRAVGPRRSSHAEPPDLPQAALALEGRLVNHTTALGRPAAAAVRAGRAGMAPVARDGSVGSALMVEPGRLSAALARLRAEAPAPEVGEKRRPDHEPPTPAQQLAPLAPSDAVSRLFRSLLRRDQTAAGRLLVALLPVQHLTYPRPVAYDLILDAQTCLRLTAGGHAPEIEVASAPRPPAQTHFRARGDLQALARLAAAGPVRRRIPIRLARVRGQRRAVEALRSLITNPLSPTDLLNAGVRLDPAAAFGLIANAIAPVAAPPYAFQIAHRPADGAPPSATLAVSPDAAAAVSELPLERPFTTTLTGPADQLLAALLGQRTPDLRVDGDEHPLALFRGWLEDPKSSRLKHA